MEKPNVQLKNVRTFAGHDGTGLNADIWINGINCMHVFDGAYGGEFEYTENTYNNPKAEQVKANIQLLDDYIAQLPPQDTPYGKIKYNRDCYIDDVLAEMEKAKTQKKMQKLMLTAIIWGVPNGDRYTYLDYKIPLTGLSKTAPRMLQERIDKIKAQYCTDGVVILNTNLTELGVKV